MKHEKHELHYLTERNDNAVAAIVEGIDRDVERGEDGNMLGLGIVMLSPTFAPIAPPTVLLPFIALTFAITVIYSRKNYHNMERKLSASIAQLNVHDQSVLLPIVTVFENLAVKPLAEDFNLIKNLKRTVKSALGGLLINPLWMPIFYMMGIQINEEKNLNHVNQAIIRVERRLSHHADFK